MREFKENYTVADWEVLSYDCESCNYHQESDYDQETCDSCGSEDIYFEYNYEDTNCKECGYNFEVDDILYGKYDGDFEDILCDSCFNNLPDEEEE